MHRERHEEARNMKEQISIQEMEKAITATKKWELVEGYFLETSELQLGSDQGDNAFYLTKQDAKDDLLEAFEDAVGQIQAWIDIMSDGSTGEQIYLHKDTKKLYDMLKEDGIIKTKKAGNAAVIRGKPKQKNKNKTTKKVK
jgi:hypothetical protein